MAMTEQRLLRFQLIGMLSLVLLLTLLLGGWLSYQQIHAFEQESAALERNEQQERQMILASLSNSTRAQLDHLIANHNRQRDSALRQQVEQAWRLAHAIYDHERPRHPQDDVAQQVIEVLRSQRFFEDRGYFFIIASDGTALLHPQPELEGHNLLNITDQRGTPVIQQMLDITRRSPEGGFLHYRWPLPGQPDSTQDKITFVRLFAPLGWIIGTGEYPNATRNSLQKQALIQLTDSQTGGEDSFLTLVDSQQSVLLASDHPELEGKRLPDHVFASLYRLALDGGGFLATPWPALGDPSRPQQRLHISPQSEWGWILLNGLYEDSHTDNRQRREAVLNQQRSSNLYTTLIALLVAPLLALGLALFYNRELGRRFTLYRENLEESQARLRRFAETDPLTGLPNRQRLADRLEHAILQAQTRGGTLALLCADLDQFKHINESLGHDSGDCLLLGISQQLLTALRPADTLSRTGGDEFTILLENIDSADQAAAIAERLLLACQKSHDVDGHELSLTLSIGIAIYPVDGTDMNSLLSHADAALHHAKACGRNNYQFYTESMNQRVQDQLLLESRLRMAMQRNELQLYYQPKFDLQTGQMSSCEALMRWDSPDLGKVPPARFIPVAEHCGLIGALGEWALREACRQIAAWQAAGLQPVTVAVNVSAHQFAQGDLPGLITRLLADSGIPARLLELELTESVLAEDHEQLKRTLKRIKALGITLSMDDFGTGFSSLSYLSHFCLDSLKIDRAFIRELPHNSEHSALTEAIIAMARALGMHCVAEGIETEEQLAFLRDHGCHTGQGFLLATPLPHQEMTSRLRQLKEPASAPSS